MVGGIHLDLLWAELPEVIGDEADLDVVLRRIGRVKDWDGAKLSGLRHSVTENRLVVRNDRGEIVKAAELPQWPTEAEINAAYVERELKELHQSMTGNVTPVWDAKLGRVVGSDEPGHPANVAKREAQLLDGIGPKVEALSAEVAELREQLAALTETHELVAA